MAVAKETGVGTELGKISAALRIIEPQRTPLQREIDRLVQVLAVFGVAAAVVVVIVYGLTRGNWLAGVLAGIATAMALLPEEFPVVLTVFMALGAWRMSQKHVLTAPAVAWPATPILVGLVQWQQEQAKTVNADPIKVAEHSAGAELCAAGQQRGDRLADHPDASGTFACWRIQLWSPTHRGIRRSRFDAV